MPGSIDAAAIRQRATYADSARNEIFRCDFMRVAPARLLHRQVAASQADVPDLLAEVERLQAIVERGRKLATRWDCAAAMAPSGPARNTTAAAARELLATMDGAR